MSARRTSALVVGPMLMLGLGVAWILSLSVRTAVRWSLLAPFYKKEVLALPQPTDGLLKHIEWDGWGWAGQNTVVYLVLDSSNALAAAATKIGPVRPVGLPCDVYQVRQLEREWFTVHFYTNTSWEHCA
jgi:hypothetical protein